MATERRRGKIRRTNEDEWRENGVDKVSQKINQKAPLKWKP